MENKHTPLNDYVYNTQLSFRPLINALKKMIVDGKPGAQQLYGELINRIEEQPELLEVIKDLSVLQPNRELVEMLLATIFPPATAENESLYAVSIPFTFKTIYASNLFQQQFLQNGSLNEITVPEGETGINVRDEKLLFAYLMILKKYAHYQSNLNYHSIHPYLDSVSGLLKYFELNVDEKFIEVSPVDELPEMPANLVCKKTNQLMNLSSLQEAFPIEKFKFEGLAIIRISDVTEQEIISQIKTNLLTINMFSDTSVYETLHSQIQSLVGIKDVKIGITPFFKVNDHFVYSESHNSNSLILKGFHGIPDSEKANICCNKLFSKISNPITFEIITDEDVINYPSLDSYRKQGAKSIILCPLKHENGLLGLLEIVSDIPYELQHHHIAKIEAVLPLFTLALEKTAESLDNQIEKVIKEKFTAIQPAVEWKFTDVALRYIVGKQHDERIKLERIAFDNVYPLYGAIDIRNSSIERTQAIQLDLIEQLQMAGNIVKKAQAEINFPLLKEIGFKIDKYITSASVQLQGDDEVTIHHFLQEKITAVIDNLKQTLPGLKDDILNYFAAIDPHQKMIYHHRKYYEESMAKINEVVARFIDKEQLEAQKVYPFYFERYVTDGVEFNAYIGQSMNPGKKFDELYLRNLKMWQLTTLAKAAQLTHNLENDLSNFLSTTQLILAHNTPISISFRTAERKFDVDGAYNIRYEIIKKRIDKVRIKDTNERFTQPGKLAIVYSQLHEANEYREYIEFLQEEHLLKHGIEEFELEELQGVAGLKGLRVDINFDPHIEKAVKRELSTVTDKYLLEK